MSWMIFMMAGFTVLCLFTYVFLKGRMRARKYVLLAASLLFFAAVSVTALVYLVCITAVSFLASKGIASKGIASKSIDSKNSDKKRKRWILGSVAGAMILVLAAIKYSGWWHGTSFSIPLGLSYYSLMIIGYLTEIYRGKEKACDNIVDYVLFVTFFPQVIAGPIGRSKDLLKQYENMQNQEKIEPSEEMSDSEPGRREETNLSVIKVRTGFFMVLVGVFEKMVLADNINIFVTEIYNGEYKGCAVILAILLYSLVIYFDFGGYSLIAIGCAKMLGVELMENFNAPYRAASLQEFWRRWHISLSTWFRDYVYIPLGGNRKGKLRRDINTMILFVLSGAWHGATAGFLLWGAIHGLYLVIAKRTWRIRQKLFPKEREKERFVWLQRGVVYLLVSIAWIPFSAGTLWKTIEIGSRIFPMQPWTLTDGTLLNTGLNVPTMIVCLLGSFLIFGIDNYQQRKHSMESKDSKEPKDSMEPKDSKEPDGSYDFEKSLDFFESMARDCAVVRYAFVFLLFAAILLAGAYGATYRETDFIYGQF